MKYILCLLLLLFICPTFLVVSSNAAVKSTQLIDQQEMTRILDDYLVEQSLLLPHVELHFKSIALPESYRVPAGRISHQVIPAKPSVIGSRRITLMTRVDGKIVSNKTVRVDLEALAEIAVVTGSLRRGMVIGRGDVELRYQDISHVNTPIFNLAGVVGKRLKRSVRLGDPLLEKQVEFPPVIKRGELVVIQLKGHGIMITAAGEAKQDGYYGEAIRVMNSNSRREVVCQVVESGLVAVEF